MTFLYLKKNVLLRWGLFGERREIEKKNIKNCLLKLIRILVYKYKYFGIEIHVVFTGKHKKRSKAALCGKIRDTTLHISYK